MKMAVLNDEAAGDQGMADRVAASFMREVALLKVRKGHHSSAAIATKAISSAVTVGIGDFSEHSAEARHHGDVSRQPVCFCLRSCSATASRSTFFASMGPVSGATTSSSSPSSCRRAAHHVL